MVINDIEKQSNGVRQYEDSNELLADYIVHLQHPLRRDPPQIQLIEIQHSYEFGDNKYLEYVDVDIRAENGDYQDNDD